MTGCFLPPDTECASVGCTNPPRDGMRGFCSMACEKNRKHCETAAGRKPECHYCRKPIEEWKGPYNDWGLLRFAHDGCLPAEDTAMKSGKLQMELVDLDFIADMAKQLQAGLKGDRTPNDWLGRDPDKWLPKYRGAVLRHLRAAHTRGAVDPETGASHWAAVATSAMICWGLERVTSERVPLSCAYPDCTSPSDHDGFCNDCLVGRTPQHRT